jgi:hypothetical protein
VVSFALSDPTCAVLGRPGSAKQERDSAPWLLSDRQHRVQALLGYAIPVEHIRITCQTRD